MQAKHFEGSLNLLLCSQGKYPKFYLDRAIQKRSYAGIGCGQVIGFYKSLCWNTMIPSLH